MKKYKITQIQNTFFVYKRFLLLFWKYETQFNSERLAKNYINFWSTPEKRIF